MFGTEPQPLKRKWKRGYWTVEGIWGKGVEVFMRKVAVRCGAADANAV